MTYISPCTLFEEVWPPFLVPLDYSYLPTLIEMSKKEAQSPLDTSF